MQQHKIRAEKITFWKGRIWVLFMADLKMLADMLGIGCLKLAAIVIMLQSKPDQCRSK